MNSEQLQIFDAEFKPRMEAFSKKINRPPHKKFVKKSPIGSNILYLPIELIEAQLDTRFSGMWHIDKLHFEMIGNAICVSLILEVMHPVTKTPIRRAGVGAVPIQVSKDTGIVSARALHKNLPAAKAFALKNAAQSLGSSFGRNLNRNTDFGFISDIPTKPLQK